MYVVVVVGFYCVARPEYCCCIRNDTDVDTYI